jgi:hypothetical protein
VKEKRNKKKKLTKRQKQEKARWANYLSGPLISPDMLARRVRAVLQDEYYGLNDMQRLEPKLEPDTKPIQCSCGKSHCRFCS